jgi:hypothetical protein
MPDPTPIPDVNSPALAAFRLCRDEVKHEQDVLAGRLNSYITSQSFLVSAYAVSMGNLNPNWGGLFRLAFPVVLCLVGFLLSLFAQPGIQDASAIIARWHLRQDVLLEQHPELAFYQLLHEDKQVRMRSRDQKFAQASAAIFATAWVVFGFLSAGLYFYRR